MPTTVLAIDQSLKHTAFCVLSGGKPTLFRRLDTAEMGWADRLLTNRAALAEVIRDHQPDGVVIEDYAFSMGKGSTNNLTKLAELGGVLKLFIHELEYLPGRNRIVDGLKWSSIQTSTEMKKFAFGKGHVTKDTMYMAKVFERFSELLGEIHSDDEADAYMHALRASAAAAVIAGRVDITDLPRHQHESLIAKGVKNTKGLAIKGALKLTPAEQARLVEI